MPAKQQKLHSTWETTWWRSRSVWVGLGLRCFICVSFGKESEMFGADTPLWGQTSGGVVRGVLCILLIGRCLLFRGVTISFFKAGLVSSFEAFCFSSFEVVLVVELFAFSVLIDII